MDKRLSAAIIAAGCAAMERGEWAVEREMLVDALERYQAIFFGRLGNLEHMGTDEFRAAHAKVFMHASDVLKYVGSRLYPDSHVLAVGELCPGEWIGPPDASLRQWSCRCGAAHPNQCKTETAKSG